jgi:hypothetical protein
MKNSAIFFSLCVLFLISACSGDVKGDLGLRKSGPDEFLVEKRPRLEIPPQFKLRPPAPGEDALNTEHTRDMARKKLISAPEVSGMPSTGEEVLLKNAGVEKADDNIKNIIRKEYDEQQDPTILDKIRQISDKNRLKTLVDPEKEKQRIEENKKNNKPITEGKTPAKSENDGKPVLEKIFN